MGRIIDEHLQVVVDKNQDLWEMVEKAYGKILNAFENDDRMLALKVSKNDTKINELEEEINDDTIRVITLQSPVASDLRLLISTLKIANQLERIADYTVNIADHILIGEEDNAEHNSTIVDKYIADMISYIITMLRKAKEAYTEQDTAKCKEVIAMDEKLDRIYGKSITKIEHSVNETYEEAEIAELNINSVLILKYMERAGDHIVNIAESTYYMIKGRSYDVHHTSAVFRDEN